MSNPLDEKTTVPLGWVFALVGLLASGGVFIGKEVILVDSRLTAIETRLESWEMREAVKGAKSRIPFRPAEE